MNQNFGDVRMTFKRLEKFAACRRARSSQSVLDEFDLFVDRLLKRLNKGPQDIPLIASEEPLLGGEPGELAVIQHKIKG